MPTDDIARLDDYTTQTGNPISSSSMDAELDQLVTTMNMKAGRSVDNTFSGANTFSGTVAITGATTLSNVSSLKTNTVSELTAASGVTIDGLVVKDFGITFTDAGEVTISAGAINIWGGYHTVDTQGDAASDDLDSINGASVAGRMLRLQAENDARTVVIKHNTGNIYNPSGGDITLDTAYGIVDLIYSAALSKWIVINTPVSAASDSAVGSIQIAVQSDQETATSTTKAVTPGRQQYHPSAAKAWVKFHGTTTTAIDASYNITGLTDNGTGDTTITIATDFSSAHYAVCGSCEAEGVGAGARVLDIYTASQAAGTIRVRTLQASSGTLADLNGVHVAMFGDQ